MAVMSRGDTLDADLRKLYRTKRRNFGWMGTGFVLTILRALSVIHEMSSTEMTISNTVCKAAKRLSVGLIW